MQSRCVVLAVLALALSQPLAGRQRQPASIPDRPAIWHQLHTPISDGFRQSLDTRTSDNLNAWAGEFKAWYLTDGRMVYRGTCDAARPTVADRLQLFFSVGEELLSKQSGNGVRRATAGAGDFDLRRSINADLSRFSHDAFMFLLFREALVHQMGPVGDNQDKYENSYGFSTSWSFWMAAEFAGVYPGDEACTNSVVVGMLPARHFLDYATLEAVDTRFQRLYPDELEVLGAGAVDPDSVMVVARLEARGGTEAPAISEVLLRDPRRPSHVLHYRGGIDVFDREVEDGWAAYRRDQAEAEAAISKYGVAPRTPPTVPAGSPFRVRPGEPLRAMKGERQAEPQTVFTLAYDTPVYLRPAGSSRK